MKLYWSLAMKFKNSSRDSFIASLNSTPGNKPSEKTDKNVELYNIKMKVIHYSYISFQLIYIIYHDKPNNRKIPMNKIDYVLIALLIVFGATNTICT